MYVKFSFLETKVILPACWGGLMVNVVGTPTLVEQLPDYVTANTYMLNTLRTKSEVCDLIKAAQEEQEAKVSAPSPSQLSDQRLAKKIYNLLKEEQYLLNQYLNCLKQHELSVGSGEDSGKFKVGELNRCNEENILVTKEYYYDCGSVSKRDLERSINILIFLYNNLNVSEYGIGKGIGIVAPELYPQFNPILEIFSKTISCVKNALPECCGTILSLVGLNRIRERFEGLKIPETLDENTFSDSVLSVR